MQTVTAEFVKGKRVLLRYDIDVALRLPSVAQGYNPSGSAQGKLIVGEEFKLKAGGATLRLCLDNASKVIIIGHLGRPEGKVVPKLSVEPIRDWLVSQGLSSHLTSGKLELLENLRFDPRESFDFAQDKEAVMEYAKELAQLGEVYINEAFSAYRPSASTTVLPTLLPHAAGLHFAEEVRRLKEVRDPPAGGHKKPFVAIMGGAKVVDKLPVINALAEKADVVLVGGKLAAEIRELASSPTSRSGQNLKLPKNVMMGKLNKEGSDIAPETVESWRNLIARAAMIVWNGPLGRIEENTFQVEKLGSAKGSYEIAKMILNSQAQIVVGGGDTVAFLGRIGLLGEFEKKGLPAGRQGFVSVGGGAMLKFLSDGTLPTIEALK